MLFHTGLTFFDAALYTLSRDISKLQVYRYNMKAAAVIAFILSLAVAGCAAITVAECQSNYRACLRSLGPTGDVENCIQAESQCYQDAYQMKHGGGGPTDK